MHPARARGRGGPNEREVAQELDGALYIIDEGAAEATPLKLVVLDHCQKLGVGGSGELDSQLGLELAARVRKDLLDGNRLDQSGLQLGDASLDLMVPPGLDFRVSIEAR